MRRLTELTNAADKTAVAQSNFDKLDVEILYASASLNFGSINGGAQADLTIAVAGAEPGDAVSMGAPSLEAGLIPFAFVSASDVVTVRMSNITGAPINPAEQAFSVAVIR